jgi:hypothetical protein
MAQYGKWLPNLKPSSPICFWGLWVGIDNGIIQVVDAHVSYPSKSKSDPTPSASTSPLKAMFKKRTAVKMEIEDQYAGQDVVTDEVPNPDESDVSGKKRKRTK